MSKDLPLTPSGRRTSLKPRKKMRARVAKRRHPKPPLPVMKAYWVECSDCDRSYDLKFTGPVKFCCFCASDKIKVTKQNAELPLIETLARGLAMGAGFAVVSHYLTDRDERRRGAEPKKLPEGVKP
jgi:hypothetical protein